MLLTLMLVGMSHSIGTVQGDSAPVEEEDSRPVLHLAAPLPMTGIWPGGYAVKTVMDMALSVINSRSDVLPWYKLDYVSEDTTGDSRPVLYIGELLPITGDWSGGNAMKIATEMALGAINDRHDILPWYRLDYVYDDSKFRVYPAVHILHRYLTTPPTKIMVFAEANSEVCQAAATISELNNLVQLSYACVSPALSDKSTYPYFFRTAAPETAVNPARVELMKIFGWKKAATLHHSRAVFDAAIQDLKKKFIAEGLEILTSEVFTDTPKSQIENLKKHDARIIFTMCNKPQGVLILCEAYKAGIVGPKYVWTFPGWFDDGWWRTEPGHDCTVPQMEYAAEGYWQPGDVTRNPDNTRGISGLTPTEFDDIYSNLTDGKSPFAIQVTQGYDGIWAMALALNATETQLRESGSSKRLTDFTYTDAELGAMIHGNMKNVSFIGIKAPIVFDQNQDPIIMVKYNRVQNGHFEMVGLYRPEEINGSHVEWSRDTPLVWAGGRPPADSTTIIISKMFVSRSLYMGICVLASLGILMAVAFLGINIKYRSTKLIKMSSPNINNIILLGCVVMYLTVYFQETATSHIKPFCTIRAFTMCLGFSLAFGGLFSKTWRIHIIFANKDMKKKVVKDSQLAVMVVILLVLDIIVLGAWQGVDPFYVSIYNTSQEDTGDGETIIQTQLDACESVYMDHFRWVILAIKGLILLFGCFLAWETRNVKIPALNDSKHIGMCIYNVVIVVVVSVILSLAITFNVQLEYCITSIFLIFGTTLTQCLIFVPKLMKLWEGRVNPEGVDEEYVKGSSVKGPASQATRVTQAGSLNDATEAKLEDLQKQLQEAKEALAEKERMLQAKSNGS